MSRTKDGRTDEEALARLPKWAQDRIRNLERDRDHAQHELERARSGEPTRLGYGFSTKPGAAGEPKGWLPDGEHVTFYFEDRHRPRDAYITVGFDRFGGLRVMAVDGPLIVKPEASNVVNLSLGDR